MVSHHGGAQAAGLPRAVRLFYSYAPQDAPLCDELKKHLKLLHRQGLLSSWEGRDITAGQEWHTEAALKLAEADVVLLLISADFIAADACYEDEMKQALRRHGSGQAQVIPVLLRPTDLEGAPFSPLARLPTDGRALTEWDDRDSAWVDVVRGIRRAIEKLRDNPPRDDLAGSGPAKGEEPIDFSGELTRHEGFFGREELLQEMDSFLLSGDRPSGWLLIQGGPGRGKSAMVAQWLRRQDDSGRHWPRHFVRRNVEGWDEPPVMVRSLAAQIQSLYPAAMEPAAASAPSLSELLRRISTRVLRPRRQRLILVIDGLDEVAGAEGQNPLSAFLPAALPEYVLVLCASRPIFPYLTWLVARDGLRCMDLDDVEGAASNEQACRMFWSHHGPRLRPPLSAEFISEAVVRAEGCLLHAVKLLEWVQDQPPKRRLVARIPRGLRQLLEQSWDELCSLPKELRETVFTGLGVLCAAREALPLPILEEIAGWGDPLIKRDFLRVTRALLLEQTDPFEERASYRPYHESFREFVIEQLGPAAMRGCHERLARHLARWPVSVESEPFHHRYVLRYGVAEHIAIGGWAAMYKLCTDLTFLQACFQEVGVQGVETNLSHAVARCPVPEIQKTLQDVLQALREETHWWRREPEVLPELLYNRLRSTGWPDQRIRDVLALPPGDTTRWLLAYPLQRMPLQCERTFSGHTGDVSACAVAPNNRWVLSAAHDGVLILWAIDSGDTLLTLAGHEGRVESCAIAPDGRRAVSGSEDRTLKVWDLDTGAVLLTLAGHNAAAGACAISPDGKRVVSGSNDRTLKVWDLQTGALLLTLAGHDGAIRACAISPDGNRVVSGSDDRTLKVWDLQTGALLRTLAGHDAAVRGCAITPDGKRIVSGSWDGTLKVWDLHTGAAHALHFRHGWHINSCAVTPDGKRALSAGDDQSLKVWDLQSGGELMALFGHSWRVSACAVTPDGRRAISGSLDRTLRVWSLEGGTTFSFPDAHFASVLACAATLDGTRLLTGSWDGTLKLWDVEQGRVVRSLEGHRARVQACAVTPDGKHGVSGAWDGSLKVWDLRDGSELLTLRGHRKLVTSCVVAAGGRTVISTSEDGTVRGWDIQQGTERWVHTEPHTIAWACGVTADGETVVSGWDDGKLRVLDVRQGQMRSCIAAHSQAVRGCAITPDGRRLISASFDNTLKVWDTLRGEELLILSGHVDWPIACAVTADGRTLISASDDKTLRLWDLASGACIDTIYGVSAFYCVTSHGAQIYAGDALGNVWILRRLPM